MSSTFSGFMRDVCRQALLNDFEALERSAFNDIPVRLLAAEEVATLAQRIMALPIEYINTLFFRYYFNFSPEDTDDILSTTRSAGRLRYARNLLSHVMGLDGAMIDDHSMSLACEAALSEYIAQDALDVWRIPKYSKAFRKKLKLVKAAQKSTNIAITIMKQVAVFILICAISFSTALVVNAQWRQQFLNWVVEIFPQFSIFTTQVEAPSASTALSQSDVVFGYLPEGYEISDVSQGRNMLKYSFLSGDGDKLFTISFTVSKAGTKSYFDTEDSKIQCVSFIDSEAYTWTTDRMTYFIWAQDNIQFQILGNIDYAELIKIAENVEL